jgi:hypothetical protein
VVPLLPAITGACGLCLIISFLSGQKAGNYNLFKDLPSNLIASPVNYVVTATLFFKLDEKKPETLSFGLNPLPRRGGGDAA